MNRSQWDASKDAREMLRFAAKRIPRQHLGLVLAELAAGAWPHWHKLHPDDWRPALCTATLRAWCLGEATLEELQRAKVDAYAARSEAADAYAAAAAADAADAAAYAAAYAYAAARWSQRWSEEFAKQLAKSADLVRRLIPYPAAKSEAWTHEAGALYRSGDSMVWLDGWSILDASAISEVWALSPSRLVAMDQAQVLPVT